MVEEEREKRGRTWRKFGGIRYGLYKHGVHCKQDLLEC